MRSVMNREEKNIPTKESRGPSSLPKISFAKAETKFKPLENRPVMAVPDERRERRPSSPSPSASVSTSNNSNPSRLRDDSKPMFQRNIGFSTPSKDGTAKK